MLSVQIVLFDGFDLLDALAPYEVFCVAEMITENALSVELVTAEGPRSVPSGTNGLTIEAGDRLDPVRPKQAAIKDGVPTGKTQLEFAFDGDRDTTIATGRRIP